MRPIAALASVLFGILFSVTASAADASDISGTLLDTDGSPVPNAAVTLLYCESTLSGRNIGQTTTDTQGRFRFPKALQWPAGASQDSFPARYCLISNPPGKGLGYLNLQQSDSPADLRLQLTQRTVVPVTVNDADGKPLPDARVWLIYAIQNGGNIKQLLIIPSDASLGERTSAAGTVDVVVPPDFRTIIAVAKDGYAMGVGDKQITLRPGGIVNGRVLAPDGKPVAGAKVVCSASAPFTARVVQTDAEGRFEAKDVPAEGHTSEAFGQKIASAGQVILNASADGSAQSGSATITLKPGQTLTQDITLRQDLLLSGTVVDADTDKPLFGIHLRMHSYNRSSGAGGSARTSITGQDGRFSFPVASGNSVQINIGDPPNGEYMVDQDWRRNAPRGMVNIDSLTENKTDAKLTLKLRNLAPLAGRVVDAEGKPVAKASVSIQGVPPQSTDAEGNFAFKLAPTDRPGQLSVTSVTLGALVPFVAGQAQIAVTVRPLVSRDCIVQTPEGTPADVLSFTLLLPATAGGGVRSANIGQFQTDSQGKCRLDKLIPGASYIASWGAKGDYSHGSARILISSSEEPIRFTAPKFNNSFGVIVENEDGEPVPDARIQFNDMNVVRNDQWQRMNNLKTDAEGAVRIEGIRGGIIEFQIHANNYRFHQASAPVGDGEYHAILTRQQDAPRHIVVVRSADGKPVPNQQVRVFARDQDEQQMTTDESGRLELPYYDQRTDITVFCQNPDLGWGLTNLRWHQDGTSSMVLRKPQTPRKVRLVTIDGKPIPNATVSLANLGDRHSSEGGPGSGRQFYGVPQLVQDQLGIKQVTDANGVATFPMADARFFASISIQSAEYGDQHKSLQEDGNPAGDEILIQKLGEISGAIILPPEAKLALNRIYVNASSDAGQMQRSSVSQDGWFEVSVEPGEYRLSAGSYDQAARYMVRDRPTVKVGPGESKEIDLEMKEGIPVRGKFIPKDGKISNPPPSMALQIDRQMGISPRPISADGTFEFFAPGPGSYELYYSTSNQSYRSKSINVPSEAPVENLEIREE